MGLKLWELYHTNTNMYDCGFMTCPMSEVYNNFTPSKYCFEDEIYLDSPLLDSALDNIIVNRESHREFIKVPLSLNALSKILILSAGTKEILNVKHSESSLRVIPSAGGRYPIEINIFSLNLEGLSKGTYHFCAEKHSLQKTSDIDYTQMIVSLCNNQSIVGNAAAVLALCANFDRTIEKYGERGYRFTYLDAGHIAQNVYLVSTELNIGCVGIGGYLDLKVKRSLRLPKNEFPIYLLAIGQI